MRILTLLFLFLSVLASFGQSEQDLVQVILKDPSVQEFIEGKLEAVTFQSQEGWMGFEGQQLVIKEERINGEEIQILTMKRSANATCKVKFRIGDKIRGKAKLREEDKWRMTKISMCAKDGKMKARMISLEF